MTKKITRPLCLLLDCNVIIRAYELGIWTVLVQACHLLVPGTVVEEALYYFDSNGKQIDIDLRSQVDGGSIFQIDPDLADLFKFTQIFAPWFIQTLHSGETEALALICTGKSGDAYFCTSDAPAIRALAMIHCSDKGISFEELLKTCGIPKSLQIQYTCDFFNTNLKQGSTNLVTGDGYASRDVDRILKSLDL